LSSIEKFNHLLNCLKGPALKAEKAFPINSENFPKALDKSQPHSSDKSSAIVKNKEERYSRVPQLPDTRYSPRGTKGKWT